MRWRAVQQPKQSAAVKRTRAGIILPLTLVVLTAIVAVTASVLTVVVRDVHDTYLRWDTQQAVTVADAALVQGLVSWDPQAVAAMPLGETAAQQREALAGWVVHQRMRRTAPLVVVVDVTAHRMRRTPTEPPSARLDPWAVQRRVARVLRLEPPPMPLGAAVVALSPLILEAATVDGRDASQQLTEPANDCGTVRDTASLTAVAAVALERRDATIFGPTTSLAPAALSAADSLWKRAEADLVRRIPVSTGLGPANAAPGLPWQPRRLGLGAPVTLSGGLVWRGLLIVAGDLILTGALHVDGVLVVLGQLDTTGGQLELHGQLLLRDPGGRASRLGPGSVVRYAPCLAEHALAAVATPRAAPFDLWDTP